jgi:methyl-accepting chemotaxis protein
MSLAKKNLLFYSAAIIVIFSIFIFMVYSHSKTTLLALSKERAETALLTFEGALNGSGLQSKDPDFTETVQAELDKLAANLPELRDFTIYDIEKQTAIASSTPENRNKGIDPEDLEAAKLDQIVVLIESEDAGTVVDVTAPLHLNGSINHVAGVIFSIQDELDEVQSLLLYMVLAGIVCLTAAIFLIWFFVIRKTTNQLKHLMLITGKLSGGDLSVKASVTSNDEIGKLTRNINSMSDALSKIIRNVASSSNLIASHSTSLADMTVQTSASLVEVAKTVEELARGATDQTSDAKTGFKNMLQLANQINNVMDNTVQIGQLMNRAETVNETGMETLIQLNEKLQINNEISSQIAENANVLMSKSDAINKIVNTIRSVADQTDLLALNAAIEAARAGEQGKGFSVVADEIRKLAEQTSDSAKSITAMITEIQKEIKITKSNIDIGEESLSIVNSELNDTTNAFHEISDTIKNSIHGVGMLISNLQLIDKDKDEVVKLIQRISDISENTAASTQEVSASVDEQTATLEEISTSADKLSMIAEELNTLIGKFSVDPNK